MDKGPPTVPTEMPLMFELTVPTLSMPAALDRESNPPVTSMLPDTCTLPSATTSGASSKRESPGTTVPIVETVQERAMDTAPARDTLDWPMRNPSPPDAILPGRT